jgi:hypothetical protein
MRVIRILEAFICYVGLRGLFFHGQVRLAACSHPMSLKTLMTSIKLWCKRLAASKMQRKGGYIACMQECTKVHYPIHRKRDGSGEAASSTMITCHVKIRERGVYILIHCFGAIEIGPSLNNHKQPTSKFNTCGSLLEAL